MLGYCQKCNAVFGDLSDRENLANFKSHVTDTNVKHLKSGFLCCGHCGHQIVDREAFEHHNCPSSSPKPNPKPLATQAISSNSFAQLNQLPLNQRLVAKANYFHNQRFSQCGSSIADGSWSVSMLLLLLHHQCFITLTFFITLAVGTTVSGYF